MKKLPSISNTDIMQEEYIGCGEISRIQKIVADSKARKLFLITGKSSFRTSGAEVALKQGLNGTKMVRFSDFEVNPQLETTANRKR